MYIIRGLSFVFPHMQFVCYVSCVFGFNFASAFVGCVRASPLLGRSIRLGMWAARSLREVFIRLRELSDIESAQRTTSRRATHILPFGVAARAQSLPRNSTDHELYIIMHQSSVSFLSSEQPRFFASFCSALIRNNKRTACKRRANLCRCVRAHTNTHFCWFLFIVCINTNAAPHISKRTNENVCIHIERYPKYVADYQDIAYDLLIATLPIGRH